MAVQLSQTDLLELKQKGFSDSEIQAAMQEIEAEDLGKSFSSTRTSSSNDPRLTSSHSAFATREQESLVKWQLELNDILERAEHILRCDKVTFEQGHLIWKPTDNSTSIFNENGVQTILKTLSMYLNRNTILSDYENDEIRGKVYNFGRELNNLIFMNYEDYGIDTEDKMNEYPMIIRQIVDIVHSAYKRALKGGERRSLREMIQISQATTTMGGQQGSAPMGMSKERGLLNPLRYISGKYK